MAEVSTFFLQDRKASVSTECMIDISTNLRYLLWLKEKNKEINRDQWIQEITKWARCTEQRAKFLLEKENIQLTPEEIKSIKNALNYDDMKMSELINGNFLELEKVSVFAENIFFLIEQWKSLNKKDDDQDFAKYIGINKGTISRWKTGDSKPKSMKTETYKKLIHRLKLVNNLNLLQEPIFLSLEPIDIISKKIWLCSQIEKIDNSDFNLLFPVLKILFKNFD